MSAKREGADDLEWFLVDAFGELPEDSYILIWTGNDKRSAFFSVPEDAAQYARTQCAGKDTYVGVGLRGRDLGPARRGGTADVVAVVGFAMDIDIAGPAHAKPNLPPDGAAARSLLESLPLDATYLIDTGHGLQAWWLFRAIFLIEDPTDRERIARLGKGWENRLRQAARRRGWDVDAVADLARVLRLPGTTNCKLEPTPVHILAANGIRYDPSDFQEPLRVEDEPEPDPTDADDEGLALDPEAEPPAELFALLFRKNRKFRESWERTRTDLQDRSASAYDLSLASLAAAAGWTDQQIVNVLIAGRRKHHDDLKLRLDYLTRTLKQARAHQERQQAYAQAAVDGAEGDVARTRESLGRVLGVPIAGLLQFGLEDARYTLQLADGRDVPLGGVDVVLAPNAFRARLYEATGITVPHFKPPEWVVVARLLSAVTVVMANPEATRHSALMEWLRAYVGEADVLRDEHCKEAVPNGDPFIKDTLLHVHAGALRKFITTTTPDRLAEADLHDRLRAARFERREVSVRLDGRGPVSRSYWAIPLQTLEGLGLRLGTLEV